MMWTRMTRGTALGLWIAVCAAIAGVGILLGADVTVSSAALWFVGCAVPPAVVLMVWRGAPPATIAEVLHAVDRRA